MKYLIFFIVSFSIAAQDESQIDWGLLATKVSTSEDRVEEDSDDDACTVKIDGIEALSRSISQATVRQNPTTIHQAAQGGRCDKIEEYLADGVEVDALDSEGWTPLHRAVQAQQIEACRLLLARDASLEAKGALGRTPLHCATQQGFEKVADFLIAQNADKDAQDDAGYTPIALAVSEQAVEVISLLEERGASLKIRSNNGGTLLHLAAQIGNKDLCRIFLHEGIDGYAVLKNKKTAADVARDQGHTGLADFLDVLHPLSDFLSPRSRRFGEPVYKKDR